MLFALQNLIPAELLIVLNRRMQADRTAHIDRAGLKLVRELRPGRLIAAHILDHLTAKEEGRHFLEQFLLAVEHADAHGGEHLVSRKCKEVDIEFGHIDRDMRHGLRAVQNEKAAILVRNAHKALDIVFHAEHVRAMGHRDQLGLRAQHAVEMLFRDITLFIRLEELKNSASPRSRLLPGNQVRMVLHDRNQDFIALV